MNPVDQKYLEEKHFIDDKGQLSGAFIQSAAMMDAVVFIGALLENSNDLATVNAIGLYLDELIRKKEFEHVHLYVQRCFSECRPHGELDNFYVASLSETILFVYAINFVAFMEKILNKLNEMQLTITMNHALRIGHNNN